MKKLLLYALPLAAVALPVRAAYLPDTNATEPGLLVIVLACVGLLCLVAGGRDDGPFRPEK
jgi:peptidoglycan/LPS O-acetylase OafA/YrhL